MTPTELQTQHPDCYQAIVALERDRVASHLRAGDASGEHALARAAIASGADFESHSAQYLSAARSRRDIALRQIEGDQAALATSDLDAPSNEAPGDDSFHMSIAQKVERLMGLEDRMAAKRAAKAKAAAL